MKPLLRNSALVTTGTSRPRNASCLWTSNGSGGCPCDVCHLKTFRTPPAKSIRYPITPCRAGESPVVIEVRAVAVVEGATVVIVPPPKDRRSGIAPG